MHKHMGTRMSVCMYPHAYEYKYAHKNVLTCIYLMVHAFMHILNRLWRQNSSHASSKNSCILVVSGPKEV